MKKILVVDDDTDMLLLVDMMLTHHDFNVKTSSRWQTVSENIRTFNPDLLLLDINLNGADGGQICKKLKKAKATQDLPVILFSAHMSEEYCRDSNAEGCLTKPFETGELIDVIMQNIKEQKVVALTL